MDRRRPLELDKICRVCICERKDMRPLFSEKIAEMLMECTNVKVEPTEGWPDKICIQCVHAVSRNHTFKTLVERSDKQLRDYIKSLTVVIEDSSQQKELKEVQTSQATSSSAGQAKLLQIHPQSTTTVLLQSSNDLQQGKLQTSQQQIQMQSQKSNKQSPNQRLIQKQNKMTAAQQQQQQQQAYLQQQHNYHEEKEKAKIQMQQQGGGGPFQQFNQQQQQQQQQTQYQQHFETKQQGQQMVYVQSNKVIKPAPSSNSNSGTPAGRKTAKQNKKNQQQQQQQQQHQQQHQQQQQHHHQQQQEIHLTSSPQHSIKSEQIIIQQPPPLHRAHQQIITQASQPTLHQAASAPNQHQMLSSSGALPQQIMLPNGQIITTAQIVTAAPGHPQLAQIISGNTVTTAPQQQQYIPQLIQTSNGQTLQLIQQSNGQQALQLVQLVPQRNIITSSGATLNTSMDSSDMNLIDEDGLMDQNEHLIESNVEDMDEEDSKEQIETIVIDEDQMHPQLLSGNGHDSIDLEDDISQSEVQELEYLEDVTVTTSTASQANDGELSCTSGTMGNHHSSMMNEDSIQEINDDDIIEEIHLEEELLEDDGSVLHVIDPNSGEFLSTSEQDMDQQHVFDECHHQVGDEIQYTVMESHEVDSANDDSLMESDVHEVLQAACSMNAAESNEVEINHHHTCDSSPPSTPKKSRKTNSKALAQNRQLAATAQSIAATDTSFEIDANLISDFIRDQTTAMGNNRYMCNLCRTEFKQFKGLHNHMHSHSNWIKANCKKQPQCDICFKSFKGPGMLKMHMKTHVSEQRTPTCNICGKTFKSKAILYRHRQTHQTRSFACGEEQCRKTFSNVTNLKVHYERKHGHSSPKYKCKECSTLFEDLNSLIGHVEMGCHDDVTEIEGDVDDNDNDNVDDNVLSVVSNGKEVFVVTQA